MTGVGPVLAPRAQADHHQVRSLGPQGRRLEAGGGQPARSEGLHHDVGGVPLAAGTRVVLQGQARVLMSGTLRAAAVVAGERLEAGTWFELLGERLYRTRPGGE